MNDQPAKRFIEELLANGFQPLPDLEEEEMVGLAATLGRRPLADPVSLTSDDPGRLIDGHQRLKAILRNGRKTIVADEWRIIPQANVNNAWEWAIQLNVQRRHLTTVDKVKLARQFQKERRWGQRRIAKVFGVSQGAVSQWLARPDPDGYTPPASIVGADGREYSTRPRQVAGQPARAKEPRSPWLVTEPGYKAITRARKMLQTEPVGKLGALQLAKLGQEVGDLIEAAEAMQNEIAEQS